MKLNIIIDIMREIIVGINDPCNEYRYKQDYINGRIINNEKYPIYLYKNCDLPIKCNCIKFIINDDHTIELFFYKNSFKKTFKIQLIAHHKLTYDRYYNFDIDYSDGVFYNYHDEYMNRIRIFIPLYKNIGLLSDIDDIIFSSWYHSLPSLL